MSNPLVDASARLVIAHRGNRVRAPENTILSLEQAVDLGADAVEFDVRVTRDGVPVLMHDATLDRTTNGRGPLNALSFTEMRTLDAGARAPSQPRGGGSRLEIPSLEEVLDRFRQTPLVIEVKEVAAIEVTEAMVRRFGAEDRILIGSSNNFVMERFCRSGLRTCASMRDAMRLIPVALAGFMPAKPSYDVLSITRRFRGVPIPVLRMAAAARRIGIATQVWTVNDPAVARALWRGGVAGIVTDDPSAILRAREE